ncbi:hypothetical protein BJV78DRAFT_1152930 [Lactifluus subvellereus]|nr:hypothetical protein BJV78DRAFT_1152930 [Lactifluus subvellereus]
MAHCPRSAPGSGKRRQREECHDVFESPLCFRRYHWRGYRHGWKDGRLRGTSREYALDMLVRAKTALLVVARWRADSESGLTFLESDDSAGVVATRLSPTSVYKESRWCTGGIAHRELLVKVAWVQFVYNLFWVIMGAALDRPPE